MAAVDLPVLTTGDCREVLAGWPAESVDAVVCDPPYGLAGALNVPALLVDWLAGADHRAKGFMGEAWDYLPQPETWRAIARVMKPGAHLVAFGGTRTVDLLTLALRLAGLEIRDTLVWLHGEGFPKGRNVAAAIDKALGAEPEVVGREANWSVAGYQGGYVGEWDVTAPATPEAAEWAGWNTQLKPAHEPIILARKPLRERTVEAQVLATGTGAINVAGCRVRQSEADRDRQRAMRESFARARRERRIGEPGQGNALNVARAGDSRTGDEPVHVPDGRWPPNVHLDPEAAAELDAAAGPRKGGTFPGAGEHGRPGRWAGPVANVGERRGLEAVEGPSRYFPVHEPEPPGRWPANVAMDEAAADQLDAEAGPRGGGYGRRGAEANAGNGQGLFGVKATGEVVGYGDEGGPSRFFYTAKASRAERGEGNDHPTVKPLALMRWLVRLITPPGGIVLDPFAGSGTTLLAAYAEGCRPAGIEKRYGHTARARRRLEAAGHPA
jgi:hypothetical protein